jgi:hypothetical protein
MQIHIAKQSIIFVGKVRDLLQFFKGIPANTTLEEYTQKSLH